MAKILYPQAITEDLDDLKELEKYNCYSHLFQRVRMLRLLKYEECSDLGEAARALGYSWRQCQRWFASYQKGGIEELLQQRSKALTRLRSWTRLAAITFWQDEYCACWFNRFDVCCKGSMTSIDWNGMTTQNPS
jgi:hypothetical protein